MSTRQVEYYGDAWGHMEKATAVKLFPAGVARIRSKFMAGNMFKVHGFTDVDYFYTCVQWQDDGHGFMYLTGKKFHSNTAWCWTILVKVLKL